VSPHPTRYYGSDDLHFITFSCYQRRPLLGSASRRDRFLRVLEDVRRQYRFVVVGYVVMPEHVHLLVGEPDRHNLSVAIKALKQAVARRILADAQTSKPADAQTSKPGLSGAPHHFWQARFYDFNVWTGKKRIEKLRYMHRNPVTRGLVSSPEEWRWSSFRAYALREKGIVTVNAMYPPKWIAGGQTSKTSLSGEPPSGAPE
jgi:REP-associated tyrosine transposase